jgi:hypothetical protein
MDRRSPGWGLLKSRQLQALGGAAGPALSAAGQPLAAACGGQPPCQPFLLSPVLVIPHPLASKHLVQDHNGHPSKAIAPRSQTSGSRAVPSAGRTGWRLLAVGETRVGCS